LPVARTYRLFILAQEGRFVGDLLACPYRALIIYEEELILRLADLAATYSPVS
jgi:hypothetical protein